MALWLINYVVFRRHICFVRVCLQLFSSLPRPRIHSWFCTHYVETTVIVRQLRLHNTLMLLVTSSYRHLWTIWYCHCLQSILVHQAIFTCSSFFAFNDLFTMVVILFHDSIGSNSSVFSWALFKANKVLFLEIAEMFLFVSNAIEILAKSLRRFSDSLDLFVVVVLFSSLILFRLTRSWFHLRSAWCSCRYLFCFSKFALSILLILCFLSNLRIITKTTTKQIIETTIIAMFINLVTKGMDARKWTSKLITTFKGTFAGSKTLQTRLVLATYASLNLKTIEISYL